MLYLWFLPSEIRSCQTYLGWYSLVINFSSPRVLPMKRHRIRESQAWKDLRAYLTNIDLRFYWWETAKHLRNDWGKVEAGPPKDSTLERTHLTGPTGSHSGTLGEEQARPNADQFQENSWKQWTMELFIGRRGLSSKLQSALVLPDHLEGPTKSLVYVGVFCFALFTLETLGTKWNL